MRRSRFLFTLLTLLCTWVHAASAQPSAFYLSGQVRDAHGPLESAYVRVLPKGHVTLSGETGYYRLELPPADSVQIECSCMGYATVTKMWRGEQRLDFSLHEQSAEIGEVVVRANIHALDVRVRTGNVEQVDLPKVREKPVPSLVLALQGAIPGLQITNRGLSGERPEVRLRGTSSLRTGDVANEPLYVLDGQIISATTFSLLNPEDLGEIKVLKDAVATALYGIRAANGVVEISSRRYSGTGLLVGYRGEAGISLPGPRTVAMMGTAEKLELERRLQAPAAPGYRFSAEYIRRVFSGLPNIEELVHAGQQTLDSLRGIETDWYRELVRPTYYQRHTLSLRGGANHTSYNFSGGFFHHGGRLKGQRTLRGTLRLGLEQRIGSHFAARLSLGGSYARAETPFGSDYDPLELVYRLNPYESKESHVLYSYPGRSFRDLMEQYSSFRTTHGADVSLACSWQIIKGLELAASTGFDFSLQGGLQITSPTAWRELKSGAPASQRGKLVESKSIDLNSTSTLRLTYSHSWQEQHELTLGCDAEYHLARLEGLGVTGYGLFGNVMSAAAIDNGITGSRRPRVNGQKVQMRDVGLGFLAGATVFRQYDLFASIKYDAASQLPKDKRWNSAWAVGVGWDLKPYPWIRTLKWLRGLNLRGSFGYTANLAGISPAHTISTFLFSPESYAGLRPMELAAIPNQHLQAEQNQIYDLGLSLEFPQVSLSISLYRRITKEALLDVPIVPSAGFEYQFQNIGTLCNEGLEGSMRIRVLELHDWGLTFNANAAYNRNKVVHLNGKPRLFASLESVVPEYEVGKPTDGVWGLQALGINPLTGLPTFQDAQGVEQDVYHTFTREDYIWLGHSTPPLYGSFSLTLSWKNLSLDLDFYYALGAYRMLSYAYVRDGSNAHLNALRGQVANTWWKPGDVNCRYPNPFMLSSGYENARSTPSTNTVYRTDLLRWSSLSLRYRLPEGLLQRMHNVIKYGYLSFQAANIYTFSAFKASDPETGDLIASLPPTLTLNLSLSF